MNNHNGMAALKASIKFSDAIESGRLDIDPVSEMRAVYAEASGEGKIYDNRLKLDYCQRMAEKIRDRLKSDIFDDVNFQELYNTIADAGKPVKLTVKQGDEKREWVALAVDIPEMTKNACAGADPDVINGIESQIRETARSGQEFRKKFNDLEVSGKSVAHEKPAPRYFEAFRRFSRNIALGTMIALSGTALFSSFAQAADTVYAAPLPPKQEQMVKKSAKDYHRDFLHTKYYFSVGQHKTERDVLKPGYEDSVLYQKEVINHLTSMQNKPLAEKVAEARRMASKIKYVSDMKKYGEKDKWCGPDRSLGDPAFRNDKSAPIAKQNGGDCEDYCVYEYKLLRLMGVPADDMFISVGMTHNGEAHAILAIYNHDSGSFSVLDNLSKKVENEKSMDGKFMPFYSLNENSAWNNSLNQEYKAKARKLFTAAMKIKDAQDAKVSAMLAGGKSKQVAENTAQKQQIKPAAQKKKSVAVSLNQEPSNMDRLMQSRRTSMHMGM